MRPAVKMSWYIFGHEQQVRATYPNSHIFATTGPLLYDPCKADANQQIQQVVPDNSRFLKSHAMPILADLINMSTVQTLSIIVQYCTVTKQVALYGYVMVMDM